MILEKNKIRVLKQIYKTFEILIATIIHFFLRNLQYMANAVMMKLRKQHNNYIADAFTPVPNRAQL